jgi:hypothetical protein
MGQRIKAKRRVCQVALKAAARPIRAHLHRGGVVEEEGKTAFSLSFLKIGEKGGGGARTHK